MDTFLFETLHGLAGKFEWLDLIGIFLARYLAFVLGAIALIWVFRHMWQWLVGIELLTSVVLARGIITEGIRFFVHRARPFVVENFVPLIPADPGELYGSIPSGHATFFFALATTIWLYNRRLGNIFFVGAVLMGIGRIFVGMHWPSDILVGALIGIFSGFIVHWIIAQIATRYFRSRVS